MGKGLPTVKLCLGKKASAAHGTDSHTLGRGVAGGSLVLSLHEVTEIFD